MRKLKRITVLSSIVSGIVLLFALAVITANGQQAASSDAKLEIDQRLVFLTVQLSSAEASLKAVNQAILMIRIHQVGKQSDATLARQANEAMDRNAGGPVPWSEFYGRTAEKFFYHPTDKRSNYYTLTFLSQQSPDADTAAKQGVPSRQGLPVHQRPPQFDYIYRANTEAEKRAAVEVAKLGNRLEALHERRRQLEAEQAGLWCKIAFRAIAGRELLSKPLYYFELKAAESGSGTNQDALRAVMNFLRVGNRLIGVVEEGLDANPSRVYDQLQANIASARLAMDARLKIQPSLASEMAKKHTTLWKLSAIAKRMEDLSKNIADAHRLALDGDRTGDEVRKNTFRKLLQQSLLMYAEALLAGDECANALANDWRIEPDSQVIAPQPVIQAPTNAQASPTVANQVTADKSTAIAAQAASIQPDAIQQVPPEVQDLFTPSFAALPPAERYKRVIAKLKLINPGFNGDIKDCKKERSEVTEMMFAGYEGMNLWPIRALTNLRVLKMGLWGSWTGVSDLSPLRGLQLVALDCSRGKVEDISPLAGMPLKELVCYNTRVNDLSSLQGMPLKKLNCYHTLVSDLSPLAGMKLVSLECQITKVHDLNPLKGMPLELLNIHRTRVKDLSPLVEMPLLTLKCNQTSIIDLSPLREMQKLRELCCDFVADRDTAILRSIKTLVTINDVPAKEFWKRVDKGESPQPK